MITLLGDSVWALPGETDFILWLQSLGGRFSVLYYIMNFFSFLGESVFIAALIALLYFGSDKQRAERLVLTLSTALLTTTFIKDLVCRVRPFNSGAGIQNFRNVDGYSFPSGHSTNSAAIYLSLVLNYRKQMRKWLQALCISVPLFVALSRMYVGAHYPTDVVTGLAIGAAFAFLINWLLDISPSKYIVYGGALALTTVGLFTSSDSGYFMMYGILFGFTFGRLLDDKVVHFESTKTMWRVLLRVVGALLVMLALDQTAKLIFSDGLYYTVERSADELAEIYRGANAFDKFVLDMQGVRTVRHVYENKIVAERIFRVAKYAIIAFVVSGVYPMLFAPAAKLWRKFGWLKDEQTTTTIAENN